MTQKRKDRRGRNLRDGEDQMPDGRYRYRYQDKNGKRQAVYSWRLVPSDRLPAGKRESPSLREKEQSIREDSHDGIDGKSAAKLTLNDTFSLYMSTRRELKERTRAFYTYMYQKYVSKELGIRKLPDIRYSDVKSFYNSLLEGGLKASSVDIIHTILRPVFTLAVRDGYIRANPAANAAEDVRKSRMGDKTRRHALTIQEQEAFVNFVASSKTYQHWLPLFTFLLGTGCRIGEAAGLRWQDCDFEKSTISINHSLLYKPLHGKGYAFHISTPKSSSGWRTVPMLQEVKQALLEEQHRQLEDGGCAVEVEGYTGFVFTTGKNNLRTPGSVNDAIRRICAAYNREETAAAAQEGRRPVPLRPFSVHNLRHTFCTRFCENESNVKVIQEIMGHSSITTTMNIYAEVTECRKKEAFNSLQGKLKIL